MKKLGVLILLLLPTMTFAESESESPKTIQAKDMLLEGNYEAAGSFELRVNDGADYNVRTSWGYFLRDQFSVNGLLGVSTFGSRTIFNVGAGARYYFLVQSSFAPFVAQDFIARIDEDNVDYNGNTDVGVLWALTPNVGFKTSGSFFYALDESFSPNFSMLGELAFYF